MYFRLNKQRFFSLRGRARYLYTEIAARLDHQQGWAQKSEVFLVLTEEIKKDIEQSLGDLHMALVGLVDAKIISLSKHGEEIVIKPLPCETPAAPPETSGQWDGINNRNKHPASSEAQWEILAMDLIKEVGQSVAPPYIESTKKELMALGVSVNEASHLLSLIGRQRVASVSGWVRTSGKAALMRIVDLSKHPMYKPYVRMETTEPPADKLQVKKALEDMKETLKDAEQKPSDHRERTESSGSDGGDF